MGIIITPVTTRKLLKDFIKFPLSLYQDNPYWIPPLTFDELKTLDKKKNPAFENNEAKYWIAYNDGQAVGRIAGIINRDDDFGSSRNRFRDLIRINGKAVRQDVCKQGASILVKNTIGTGTKCQRRGNGLISRP